MADASPKEEKIIYLRPNELKRSDIFNARPYSTEHPSPKLERNLQGLIRSIETDGQFDPVIVTEDHTIICGDNRVKAITCINEFRAAKGRELLFVKCIVKPSFDIQALRRMSIAENEQRENLSDMDRLYLIMRFRKEGRSTRDIANTFSRSTAWVTEREKLQQLSPRNQQLLHEGLSTAQTCKLLIKFTIKEQEDVIEEVVRKSQENATDKALEESINHAIGPKRATSRLAAIPQQPRVTYPEVLKVVREKYGKKAKEPVERYEMIEMLKSFLPQVPATDPLYRWLHYLTGDWAEGRGDDNVLRRRFSAIHLAPKKPSN
jgi:ParB/RepB/Spo0J family partition protein